MLGNDNTFVGPVVWFPAADRGGGTGIEGEFEVQDGFLDASRVEAVPMGLNDGSNGGTSGRVGVGADDKVLDELGIVAGMVPEMDIGTDVFERCRRMADSVAILLEQEDVFVDVVAVIDWDVTIDRFGSPDLGWNVDLKGAGNQESVGYSGRGMNKRNSRGRQGRDGKRTGSRGSTGAMNSALKVAKGGVVGGNGEGSSNVGGGVTVSVSGRMEATSARSDAGEVGWVERTSIR